MSESPKNKLTDIDQLALLERLTTPVNRVVIETLRQADGSRTVLTPIFLREIKAFLKSGGAEQQQRSPIFFIFHLLGSWRERSTYPLLAAILRLPPNVVHGLFGDAITLTCHRVLLSVYDGNPDPLHGIILDSDADEMVRSRAFTTLTALTLQGHIDRNSTAAFLRNCYTALSPQSSSVAWIGWQNAIATLGFSEMSGLVKDAFERGFIDPSWVSYQHFSDDLAAAKSAAPIYDDEEFSPFGDIVEEFSGWSSFSERTSFNYKGL